MFSSSVPLNSRIKFCGSRPTSNRADVLSTACSLDATQAYSPRSVKSVFWIVRRQVPLSYDIWIYRCASGRVGHFKLMKFHLNVCWKQLNHSRTLPYASLNIPAVAPLRKSDTVESSKGNVIHHCACLYSTNKIFYFYSSDFFLFHSTDLITSTK